MQTSTELEFPADAHQPAAFGLPRINGPLFFSLRETARNDAAYAHEASPDEESDAWARHAYGANGFGGVAAGDPTGTTALAATLAATVDATGAAAIDRTPFARPDSYELYHAARRGRSIMIGEAIAAAVVAVRTAVREAFARYRMRRQAAATYKTLRGLDDHVLHDLGFDRSELESVAAEAVGGAERTRMRLLLQGQR